MDIYFRRCLNHLNASFGPRKVNVANLSDLQSCGH